jgi:hypothetical protein
MSAAGGRGSDPTRDDFRTTRVGPDQTVGSNRRMATSRVRTIRGKNLIGWKRPFEGCIPLPRGRLVTPEDAGNDIAKLPKSEHSAPEWQAVMECLILVAEKSGPTMMARIGVMRALNRHIERVFNPDWKDPHWGRRKPPRDR